MRRTTVTPRSAAQLRLIAGPFAGGLPGSVDRSSIRKPSATTNRPLPIACNEDLEYGPWRLVRLRRLLPALLVLAPACGEPEKRSTAPGTTSPTAVVPAIDVGGRTAHVEVYPGALVEGAKLSVESVSATDAYRHDRSRALVGPVWQLRLEGQPGGQPAYPVEVRLPYDPKVVGEDETVRVSRWDGRRWEPMSESEADPLAGVVRASVDHFSTFAPTSAAGIREIGRWYGTSRRVEHFGGESPLTWAQTAWTRTETFRWQMREERHERLGWRRVVFENAVWELVETKFDWIRGKRGGAIKEARPGQAALRLGKSYGEADLNGLPTAEEQASVEEAKRRLVGLRAQARDLVRRHGEAAAGSPEQAEIATEFQDVVEPALKRAQFDIDSIEFASRPKFVVGSVDYERDAATRGWIVSIDAELSDIEPRQYVRRWLYAPPLGYDGKVLPQDEARSSLVFGLKSMDLTGPVGSVLRHESRSGNTIETHEYSGLAPETDDEPRIAVKGHAYHRIHLPLGDTRGNFVGSGGASWGVLASRLVPVGRLRVELFRRGAEQTSFPVLPMASTHTEENGTFSVTGSAQRGDVLRIVTTYDLADAQVKETCRIDVPMVALDENGILGDSPSIQADWMTARKCEVSYRYAGKTVTHDLGDDARFCVLRKDAAGKLSLEFNGMNALLVNTLCYRGRHLNQILNPFEVEVGARVAEIQAGCPTALQEAVDARLATDVADGKTKVKFQGYEVCFAATTTMILDALWLQALAPDGEAQQIQIEEISQAIYDYMKGTVEASREAVEAATAPDAPALSRQERVRLATHARNVFDYPFPTKDAGDAAGGALPEFGRSWPYVVADARHDNKQWLLSQGGYRPWQWVHVTNGYLQNHFGGRIAHVAYTSPAGGAFVNVFDPAATAEILFRLGSGAVASTSIRHRDAQSRPGVPHEGGHVMALMGVVVTTQGAIVRLLMNDPYGDLTQHPDIDGYYGSAGRYNRADPERDFDPEGHKGAYAPYGNWPHKVGAWEGKLTAKWTCFFWRPDMASVSDIGERLLKAR